MKDENRSWHEPSTFRISFEFQCEIGQLDANIMHILIKHTRKQWKTDYLIQIEYQLHWMVNWKQDMRGSNHSYLFHAFRHLWKLHMKNWYPVSLLTAAPRGDGTQSRNQSNEPPSGDSLLFKSDLIPLLSPTLPRDPKGGGFNWLVHYLPELGQVKTSCMWIYTVYSSQSHHILAQWSGRS